METCRCYLSFFEWPHAFLLIWYQLIACTIFLMHFPFSVQLLAKHQRNQDLGQEESQES